MPKLVEREENDSSTATGNREAGQSNRGITSRSYDNKQSRGEGAKKPCITYLKGTSNDEVVGDDVLRHGVHRASRHRCRGHEAVEISRVQVVEVLAEHLHAHRANKNVSSRTTIYTRCRGKNVEHAETAEALSLTTWLSPWLLPTTSELPSSSF